ncbi:MAG: LPS assembly protein LptD [Kiritimatiellae bacterium]|nr:LPS assembly protein LptD [Kiritimatiellia bacterium]
MEKRPRPRLKALAWRIASLPFCAMAIAADVRTGAAQPELQMPIEIQALRMEWTGDWIVCSGRVVVKRGSEELRADELSFNQRTQEVHARGNVVLVRSREKWECSELHGNFGTGEWKTGPLRGLSEPLHWSARTTERSREGVWKLKDATVTTCRNEAPHTHYRVTGDRITIVPGRSVTVRGATWYLGGVPILYLPRWSRDLEGDTGFSVRPGFNSRMGAFLLGSYKWRVNEYLKTRTHFDYRTRRGAAVGEDLEWDDPVSRAWPGSFSIYFADDQNPCDDLDVAAGKDVESQRYRLQLNQGVQMTPRDSVLLRVNYLSDSDVLEDFFEAEFRQSRQPENHVSYLHRSDLWTAGILIRKRLNNFYTAVERLPEVTFDLLPRPLGDTLPYYDGRTTMAGLKKCHRVGDPSRDYDTLRLDTWHEAYYPQKLFGFLSVTPRAGWRGTYYTDSPFAASEGTNGVKGVEQDGEGRFRSSFELGVDASFRMFRTISHEETQHRHIAEPYVSWGFVPEPSVPPRELYQFDEVDRVDKANRLRLGMRNKWQRKRGNTQQDLVDLDVYAGFNLNPATDGEMFEKVTWDANLRPWRGTLIELDGEYDAVNSEIRTSNVRLRFRTKETVKLDLEHRYRKETSNLVTSRVLFAPTSAWGYDIYGRYEFEAARVEEFGISVQRNLDCLAVRTGVGVIPGYTDDGGLEHSTEWRVLFELWLTAFPHAKVGGRLGG